MRLTSFVMILITFGLVGLLTFSSGCGMSKEDANEMDSLHNKQGKGEGEEWFSQLTSLPVIHELLQKKDEVTESLQKIINDLQQDSCQLADLIIKTGSKMLYFQGEVYGGGPVAQVFEGTDYIWDLYHHQVTAFTYEGKRVCSNISISAGKYAGVGVGFDYSYDNVNDSYNGWFVGIDASLSVPLIKQFFSVGANFSCVLAGKDNNENGIIDIVNSDIESLSDLGEEVLSPPDGPMFCAVGGQAGIGISCPLSPIDGCYTSAFYTNNKSKTEEFLEDTGAYQVDQDSDDVFIEFGDDEMTHTERGALVAQSILKRGVSLDISIKMAMAAILIGIIQDHGNSICD